MTENPWRHIDPPGIAETVNARRVDSELPWNFFWARGADNRVLLTLSHDQASTPLNPPPRLRDIEVSLSPPDVGNSRILALKLLDMSQLELFHTLCRDIISASIGADSEAEAVSVALMRTWRWHYLLRGGGGLPLSTEAQMGLLAELIMLERYILPNLEAQAALESWRGPLDSPKDFQVGRLAVEVKAHRGGATSSITITSEDQLDESSVDALFLYVIELNRAPTDGDSGLTIQEVSDRIRGYLDLADPGTLQIFEALLLAAGLNPDEDYSNQCWIEGASHIYSVAGEFPRITSGEIRSGVSRVRYTVTLGDCVPYLAQEDELVDVIRTVGGYHGD